MARLQHNGSSGNTLLNSFPDDVRQRLNLIVEDHDVNAKLIDADSAPKWLYFPHFGAVVSLTRSSETGATVEVGIVGFEGLVSPHALLAPMTVGADAVVQVSGRVSRARIETVREVLDTDAGARQRMHAFAGVFLTQVSQHAFCNRLHSIEQRLAKWLLGVHDRIESNEMDLTHDFLAHMLGIRRSGVTIAVGEFEKDGLIQHARNSITLVDREGMEARACECYGVIAEATRLLVDR